MWIDKDVFCDKCGRKIPINGRYLQIGNQVIAELCNDCTADIERLVRSELKTHAGPNKDF